MKVLSKKSQIMRRRNYDDHGRLVYEDVTRNVNYIIVQVVCMFLWAMSMHGYGAKRLNEVYGWFLEIMRMPEKVLGKKLDADDMIAHMEKKYGIDFDQLRGMKYNSYEEYMSRGGKMK